MKNVSFDFKNKLKNTFFHIQFYLMHIIMQYFHKLPFGISNIYAFIVDLYMLNKTYTCMHKIYTIKILRFSFSLNKKRKGG